MLGGIGGVSPSYFVTETTFDDLKATGNLRLIRDVDLRNKVNDYYRVFANNHARVLARTTDFSKYILSILPAEKRQAIDMAARSVCVYNVCYWPEAEVRVLES